MVFHPLYFVLAGQLLLIIFGVKAWTWLAVNLSVVCLLLLPSSRYVWICIKTAPRDIRLIFHVARLMWYVKRMKDRKRLIVDEFDGLVEEHPDKVALISADTGESLTFRQAQLLSCRIAAIFRKAGFQHKDVVGVYMENRLEYLPAWIGLSRIGLVSSLLNTNLRSESLAHCIKEGNCKALIFSDKLSEAALSVADKLMSDVKLYNIDDKATFELAGLPECVLGSHAITRSTMCSIHDDLLHIFTSGTTGLPKAALIKGIRCASIIKIVSLLYRISRNDVVYTSLPLYHSNAGIMMAGQLILTGATLVIREKFSASKFFQDCASYNATVSNYIGETCRYLLATPVSQYDKSHKLRLVVGNGLRPALWKAFQSRFNIPQIGEFYGSAEGNANVSNNVCKFASVGYVPVLFNWLFPMRVVRVDADTHVILRTKDGLAQVCPPGEVGELVCRVDRRLGRLLPFDGYLSKLETSKKIVHNVTRHGDAAFRSGDLLHQDEEGYLYFHDRMGDTYRWKGENVSANEVEGVLSRYLGLTDVVSYGVAVPGTEGKAGMVCIADPYRQLDVAQLRIEDCASLPKYARPIFIRVSTDVEETGTFKYVKAKLRSCGFDPDACGNDLLYYWDDQTKVYRRLCRSVFDDILVGKVRF